MKTDGYPSTADNRKTISYRCKTKVTRFLLEAIADPTRKEKEQTANDHHQRRATRGHMLHTQQLLNEKRRQPTEGVFHHHGVGTMTLTDCDGIVYLNALVATAVSAVPGTSVAPPPAVIV